jgi:diguanylate cyclase
MTSLTPSGTEQQVPLLAHALSETATAIFITDSNGKIVWVNAAFCKLSGYLWTDLVGSTPALLKSGIHSDDFYTALWSTLRSGKVWQDEMVDRRKDGSYYTIDGVITPLLDGDGTTTHYIAIQHDISQRKADSALVHEMAYQDYLTKLPNRASFKQHQDQALDNARRNQLPLATLFIDLDNFKPVNDALGHLVGDALLEAIGDRLRATIRRDDVVARVGGDEFAILLSQLPDTNVAGTLAQKVVDTVSAPFSIQGHEICIGASIGIAIFPQDGTTVETLMKHADQAMYRAKGLGGNQYQYYAPAVG